VGKISKSRGASPFSELLAEFSPETIRFFLLSTHYRRPIDFSEERIRQVQTGMEAFYRFFKRYQPIAGASFYDLPLPIRRDDAAFQPGDQPLLVDVAARRTGFLAAMDDDFNTGGAIGELFDLLRRLNRYVEEEKLEENSQQNSAQVAALKQGTAVLRELAGTLGLFRKPPPEKKSAADDQLIDNLVKLLIEARADARKAKNFAAADKIRNSLVGLGIILEDRPGGTEWKKG
jgi:cysteinyl-tRNA synthetase